jgi:hypothetical protein
VAKKLGDFQTPTGASGNIFNISDWASLIVGAIVLIVTFATGQHLANKIQGKVPGVDATIEQPWASPAPIVQSKQKVTL